MDSTPLRRRDAGKASTVAVVALLMLLVAACTGGDEPSGSGGLRAGGLDPVETAAPGETVRAITFDRFDGTPGSIEDYRGKLLVVNFFASWCVPCITEMPDFEAVHQSLGDDVAFLGINVNDTLDAGKDIATRTGVTYDLARDPRGEILRSFGGKVMPTTALVSPEGKVVELASKKLDKASLTELIEAHR